MWRSLFLALGLYCCILGAESLALEKAVLKIKKPGGEAAATSPRVITPPEWAPWSLMSGGAIVLLYSITLPRRNA